MHFAVIVTDCGRVLPLNFKDTDVLLRITLMSQNTCKCNTRTTICKAAQRGGPQELQLSCSQLSHFFSLSIVRNDAKIPFSLEFTTCEYCKCRIESRRSKPDLKKSPYSSQSSFYIQTTDVENRNDKDDWEKVI